MGIKTDTPISEAKSVVKSGFKNSVNFKTTNRITEAGARLIIDDLISRRAETRGEVFDCHVLAIPFIDIGNENFKLDIKNDENFHAFCSSLKDIQSQLRSDTSISNDYSRRVQLLVNYGEFHWSAIDFEITRDGINSFVMDAVQLSTVTDTLNVLSNHFGNENVFVAHTPNGEIQKGNGCFIFSIDHIRKFSNFQKPYAQLEERASQADHGPVKNVNIISWMSLPPQMVWMTTSLAGIAGNYEKANPDIIHLPANKKGESFHSRLGTERSENETIIKATGSKIAVTPSRYINNTLNLKLASVCERGEELVDLVKDTQVFLAKPILSHSEFLAEQKRVRENFEEKYKELETMRDEFRSTRDHSSITDEKLELLQKIDFERKTIVSPAWSAMAPEKSLSHDIINACDNFAIVIKNKHPDLAESAIYKEIAYQIFVEAKYNWNLALDEPSRDTSLSNTQQADIKNLCYHMMRDSEDELFRYFFDPQQRLEMSQIIIKGVLQKLEMHDKSSAVLNVDEESSARPGI